MKSVYVLSHFKLNNKNKQRGKFAVKDK